MEIRKELVQSLRMKIQNAECYQVVFERSYSYLRLSPACSKIAQTSVKVGDTKLLPLLQLQAQELAFNW